MNERIELVLDILIYLLPIISYLIGVSANKLKAPKPIAALLRDGQVIALIDKGIREADLLRQSNADKREYVREWAKAELRKLLGESLPDSTINFLIEMVLVRRKARR